MAAQWPPRSPHEALLSTPGGREKMRRLAERTSPSPSPSRLRTSRSAAALVPRSGTSLSMGEDALFEGGDMDEDEDEETLQLKLQAIQARLRLKKLQAAKAQRKPVAAPKPVPEGNNVPREVPLQSRLAAARDRMDRQAGGDTVQVPASPVKKSQHNADLQTSPQRVLLGIDKGLRGADVSLKRAPSQKRLNEAQQGQGQLGGYLRRAKSPFDGHLQQEAPRPPSFNERLASARTEEVARQEKRERTQKARSTAFGVGREEMEGYKAKASELPDLPSKPNEFSRDQILSAMGRPAGRQLQRSQTAPNIGQPSEQQQKNTAGPADSDGAFEPYSGLHLSKRILPHNVLARAVSGKKAYMLKDLLRVVKAPEWSLPDNETDIVVFAIVASKTDPRNHRPGPGGDSKQDRGKYMVLTLVDLTYEVDLFLFNSGFDRFWKLTPGTVLAILNPGILPPPPGREATNRFGLVINSDEDTILEVGSARDIGYCKSIKKDGSYCKSWVNARRTEYCEFHTNEAVRKARTSRIEMSSSASFGGVGGGTRWKANSRPVHVGGGGAAKSEAQEQEERRRGRYDRATQSQYFVSTAHRHAADPDDERVTGIADRKEREEALKRRLAQKEKERDIARRLGELGAGAGREYMTRAANRPVTTTTTNNTTAAAGSSFSSAATSSFTTSSAAPPSSSATTSASSFGSDPQPQPQHPGRKWDARALGLVGRRGADQPKIHLGPPPTTRSSATTAAKRKRPESSGSNATSIASAAAGVGAGGKMAGLGWGAVLKDKLGRMKEGERFDGRRAGGDAASGVSGGATGAGSSGNAPPVLPAPGGLGASLGGARGGMGTGATRGDKSPVRKKTRFVTEKGIREAGRESLGEPLSAALKSRRQVVLDDDDDEDELIILK